MCIYPYIIYVYMYTYIIYVYMCIYIIYVYVYYGDVNTHADT